MALDAILANGVGCNLGEWRWMQSKWTASPSVAHGPYRSSRAMKRIVVGVNRPTLGVAATLKTYPVGSSAILKIDVEVAAAALAAAKDIPGQNKLL